MPDDGARRIGPGPPRPGSLLARARELLQVAEFHGWLARQPPEARVAAALAEVALEAVVVAFAIGNAKEP
jgi:hypothetical protein